MTNQVAYCVDCEWYGKQSACTMKWGTRFCPKCRSRRIEVRSVDTIEDSNAVALLREAGNIDGALS